MFFVNRYCANEIEPGSVMFVSIAAIADDEDVAEAGGAFEHWRNLDSHYVLVVEVNEDTAAVTPLTSHRNSPDWLPLDWKVGHRSGWVEPSTFYDPSQVWPVPKRALIRAARIGGDLSMAGARNRVTRDSLDKVIEDIRHSRRRGGAECSLLTADAMWQAYWASYRSGELWAELRMSSVVLAPRRVRFVTGRG